MPSCAWFLFFLLCRHVEILEALFAYKSAALPCFPPCRVLKQASESFGHHTHRCFGEDHPYGYLWPRPSLRGEDKQCVIFATQVFNRSLVSFLDSVLPFYIMGGDNFGYSVAAVTEYLRVGCMMCTVLHDVTTSRDSLVDSLFGQ